MESSNFYNDNIIGLVLDTATNTTEDSGNKNFYVGCVLKRGILNTFPVASPNLFWHIAACKLGVSEIFLTDLAGVINSKLLDYSPETIMPYDFSDVTKVNDWIDELIEISEEVVSDKKASKYKTSTFDNRFSTREHKLGIIANELQKMSIQIVEKQIHDIVDEFKLNSMDFSLSISGDFRFKLFC